MKTKREAISTRTSSSNVGVSHGEVQLMASNTGCKAGLFLERQSSFFLRSGYSSKSCSRQLRHYRLDRDKYCLIRDRIYNDHENLNWSCNTLGVRNFFYLDQLIVDIIHLEVREGPDKYLWSTSHDGTFSVGALRRLIDDQLLPSMATNTTWEKILPRKVNIFMWRLNLNRLPHRFNLSSKGIDILKISCPSCNGNVESNTHIFFECLFAKEVWKIIRIWSGDSFPFLIRILIGFNGWPRGMVLNLRRNAF
nr:RNA-directed DNA polymerase, eukaryota [Tanacetum cinerariifolium]